MLRIGTDCSGIEAPIQALLQLGIDFSHEFSSDIDKYCIQSIKANYEPKVLFGDPDGSFPNGDITTRNIEDVPDIDLYVCGFPCQPFSKAGPKKGLEHKSGNVFWSCLEVIKIKQPKFFILENVKGLLSNDKGKTWGKIQDELKKLKEYKVKWKVLNTKDFGIPQNRERIYIVGSVNGANIFDNLKKRESPSLQEFIDRTDTCRETPQPFIKKRLSKILNEGTVYINAGFNYNGYPNGHLSCPCLLAGSTHCFFNVHMMRKMNVKEWLMMQGFSLPFTQVVSDRQMKKQIGNSMSVNVVKEIIKELMKIQKIKKN